MNEHWVPTYSKYIDDYLEGSWDYYPGEHHFVAMYLLPRLLALGNKLGHPHYINPDGTKNQPGDIVYYSLNHPKLPEVKRYVRLAIEVKQATKKGGKLPITRGQYNGWIRPSRAKEGVLKEPNVVVAVCHQGIFISPWSDFCSIYITNNFKGEPPLEIPKVKLDEDGNKTINRNAKPFDPAWLNWSGREARLETFALQKDPQKASEMETAFVSALSKTCVELWG